MRSTNAIVAAALAAMALAAAPTESAESVPGQALSGTELQKILIGNTLKRTNEKGERRIYMFVDGRRLVYASPDSARHPDPMLTTWKVGEDSRLCWRHPPTKRQVCYSDFRAGGRKLIAFNPSSGNALEFTLVKGFDGFDPAKAKPLRARKIVSPTPDEIRRAFAGHSSTFRITGGEMKLEWEADGVLHREVHRDTGEIFFHTGSWSVTPDSTYCQFTGLGQTCFKMEKDGNRLWRLRDGVRVFEAIPLKD